MQIPILSGISTDTAGNVRVGYPVNMMPVPKSSGISDGYVRPALGIVRDGAGSGIDRGGINWDGVLYRVMGTKLTRINADGSTVSVGDVGGTSQVSMDYSFDRLAIASDDLLYYYDGTTLSQVTDPDLGRVVSLIWVDGYFMTTDGEYIVVTDLADPTSVNPLKYGSAEVDPDPIQSLVKIRNEPYAVGRYTTEVFSNVGGDGFPFGRIDGAQIQKGAVGTHACTEFAGALALVGSGRNEAASVYLCANGDATKIATQDIDRMLQALTEAQLSMISVDTVTAYGHELLYIHLPDRTLVYDYLASRSAQAAVWHVLTTAVDGYAQYRARNFVWTYDQINVGDPQTSAFGHFSESVSSHWGSDVRWEVSTPIVYGNSRGALFSELELVALPGRVAVTADPIVNTSYSVDGISWSQSRPVRSGRVGDTRKRMLWLNNGYMRSFRIQRFTGYSDAHLTLVRLEAQLVPLGY